MPVHELSAVNDCILRFKYSSTIAEGYATAATVAKYGNVPTIAAFDSGNLLAVATALRERYKDKPIIIAGDDDHRLENNPGRAKALEAAAAIDGVAIFPELSAEQREQRMTDFNNLGRAQPEVVARHLEAAVHEVRQDRAVRREHSPSMELAR